MTHDQVKPDGVERGLVGEIIARFERKGYKLAALKLMHPTQAHLENHYCDLKTKSFFPRLVAYMLSGPVVGMVWEGKDAVKTGRKLLGTRSLLMHRRNESSGLCPWHHSWRFLYRCRQESVSWIGCC